MDLAPIVAAAQAADAQKALDVKVLDVEHLVNFTDAFVICTGTSDRHVQSIVEKITVDLKRDFARAPERREGERDATWVLLDYLDFVVHVFLDETREFYGLERLWGDAPVVDWQEASRDDTQVSRKAAPPS